MTTLIEGRPGASPAAPAGSASAVASSGSGEGEGLCITHKYQRCGEGCRTRHRSQCVAGPPGAGADAVIRAATRPIGPTTRDRAASGLPYPRPVSDQIRRPSSARPTPARATPARPRPTRAGAGAQAPFSDEDDVLTVDVRRGWRRPGSPASSGEPPRAGGRPPTPPQAPRPVTGRGGPPRRGRRLRWVVGVAVLLVVVWVALIAWAGFAGWGQVHRVDAMPTSAGRPSPESPGTTYLLVGSDSREGLTPAERKPWPPATRRPAHRLDHAAARCRVRARPR